MEEKERKLSPREYSRLLATIAIYNEKYDYFDIKDIINVIITSNLIDEDIQKAIEEFSYDEILLNDNIKGVIANSDSINNIIKDSIKNSKISLDQLDKLVLSILQCAVFELIKQTIDNNIIISQYVIVANYFFEKGEISIINGVLNSIAEEI